MATLIILKDFKLQLTLIPDSNDNSNFCWFIVNLSVNDISGCFGSSLTGIFQSRHNNFSTNDVSFFQYFIDDLSNIVVFLKKYFFNDFDFILNRIVCKYVLF